MDTKYIWYICFSATCGLVSWKLLAWLGGRFFDNCLVRLAMAEINIGKLFDENKAFRDRIRILELDKEKTLSRLSELETATKMRKKNRES